jgi:2-polyprenyl-3-methyl-5-hydroxy-6-metoxy-1,4-benzoquinol methylase
MVIQPNGGLERFPSIKLFEAYLNEKYPFMRTLVARNYGAFGDKWAMDLETLLDLMFGNDKDALYSAIDGYATFAMDALRLQKRFEKERNYIKKSYGEAAQAVYHNETYMMSLYLPGILLSHYLWPHHYRQKEFCEVSFIRDIQRARDQTFWDVGIGTGFYSRLVLEKAPDAVGRGYDISEYSKRYTEMQVRKFGFHSRYSVTLRDVIHDTPREQASFLVSVEVLEHLEDPLSFLRALRQMLKPGGKAFVTAAITAPNEDHIYLYNNSEEVLEHLRKADFKLEQCLVAAGYPPKTDEPVPLIGAYIVT